MQIARALRRAGLQFSLIFFLLLPALAAERPRIKAEDYVIDATINPKAHRISARARIRFTALEDVNFASFELNNGLRVSRILDSAGRTLSGERVTQENSIRVSFSSGLTKGTSYTITVEYEGTLANADDSPVEGLKLAYIGEDTTYLLYPGRWFPITNYGIDRFTAAMNITAPEGYTVIGSGPTTVKGTTTSFSWQKPSFPGTVIVGPYEPAATSGNVKVYVRNAKKQYAAEYADTASKELEFFSSLYGPAPGPSLKVVELPDDTVPAWWAPEIAALATRDIGAKVNYRMLANSIAHQWWGAMVSPATKDDWWMTDGGARASEMRYVQNAAGEAAFEDSTRDMAVGALAYDTTPLATIGKLDTFSPEFQALVTDKGGMIFHMLRWVIGEAAFDKTMKDFMAAYGGKSARVADLQAMAEQNYGEKLTAFFSQWVEGTGAPEFKLKYTVLRVKKGFRIAGQISQDLDLFRMPLELKVDTDGQSEMKRIEVVGTESQFSVDTFGKPRRLTLDPNNWVLKNSPELKVRVSIRRGQELTAQGSLAEALAEFNKALEVNKNSSLAHYRIAEVFYLQHNYQSAANEYRESINGDGEPRWTEVWSHIQLGKIFDVTGQRTRAVNEYRQAIQTNDNTQGALDEARKYLETPFQRDKKEGQ